MKTYRSIIESPVGTLLLEANDEGITSLAFSDNIQVLGGQSNDHIVAAELQLQEYFKGVREDFDLPLSLDDHPPFYQKVWQELQQVPYGDTKSYHDIATTLGDPKSVRAVGTANGKNPIAIIIPCHRVIGKNGKLVGYAWGIDTKRWLLRHEIAHSPVPEHLLF